ncbi:MAG: hypothetical protein L0Y75_08475 [Acidobacteria bacterium]|nr:hypothetical protein [Acidobacteriota bacterium]
MIARSVGLLIVKLTTFERPPPGAGLNTVMETVPARAMRVAFTVAVSFCGPSNFVGRSSPFQRTTEFSTKLLLFPAPLTVKAKAGPPATIEAGFRLRMLGVGLLIVIESA